MLALEPWCYHPDQIALLTDKQILDLYAKPAAERAKQLDKDKPMNPAIESDDRPAVGLADAPEPGSREFRDWVIAQFTTMGMSRAAAERQYEEQARDFKPEYWGEDMETPHRTRQVMA